MTTDEMLDMGDDVANAQLNMYLSPKTVIRSDSYGCVQAGQKNHQWGIRPTFHGTGDDITAVDKSKRGVKTKSKSSRFLYVNKG